MIVGIVKFFLLIFIISVLLTAFWLFRLIGRVNETFRSFSQDPRSADTRSRRRGNDNEKMTGKRGRNHTDKKIFKKDEGEYVDYQEV